MTERTVAKQSQVEDDAISLTSTQESEYDPEKEFIVTRILAEKTQNGKKMFLILWEDYPEEKSTWEPKDHISPEILEVWAERKKREKKGLDQPFDVDAFQAKLSRLAKEREQRKKRRKAKRKSLGIPVPASDSDTPMTDQDDTSSDEAEESILKDSSMPNFFEGVGESSAKPSKPPVRFLVKGSNARQIDEASSIGPTAESGRKTTPQGAFGGTSVATSKSHSETEKTKPLKAPPHARASSTSSSDTPLFQKKRQKLPDPELRQPESGRTVQSGKKLPEQERRGSSSSTSSRLTHPSKPPVAPEVASMVLENSSVLFIDESSPPEPRPRGRPPKRGKIATRGGTTMARRNVFELGTTSKSRGRKVGTNLLRIATDPSKDPKMAGNRRVLRKLELQGRDVAEGAPDLNALGGLFNPAEMSSVQPVRPSTLRKSSSNIITRDLNDPGEDADMDDLFEEKRLQVSTPMLPPTPTKPYTGRPICYFWDKSQKDGRQQGCTNGYECQYLHEYRLGAPIAAPPPGWVEPSFDDSASGVHSANTSARKMICFFWDRAEKDKKYPPCGNGSKCPRLHSYEPGASVATPPPGWVEPSFDNSASGTHPASGTTSASGTHSASGIHSAKTSLRKFICYFWDRAEKDNTFSPCTNGSECPRLHSYEPGAIISTPPPGWTDVPRSSSNIIPLPASKPTNSSDSKSQPQSQQRSRLPWDPYNPVNAICYFWRTSGSCIKETKCKYYHSTDSRLPLAPSLHEQMEIRKNTICRHYLDGFCEKVERGEGCMYSHDLSLAQTIKPSNRSPDKSDFKDGPALPPLSEPRKKTVKFKDEPDLFDEPTPISPPRDAPDRQDRSKSENRPQSRLICAFWKRGNCRYGDSCHFLHRSDEDEQDRHAQHQATDVQMPYRLEHGEQDQQAHPMQYHNPEERFHGPEIDIDNDMENNERISPGTETITSVRTHTAVEEAETIPLVAKSARKKVGLAEYQKQKAIKKMGSRAKKVFFGRDESQFVILDFGEIQNIEDSAWKQEFAKLDIITFSQICMAQDFRAQQGFLQRRVLFTGSIMAVDADEAVHTIEKVGDELVLKSAGLIALFPEFAILLFPASKEEWRYLEASPDYPKEGRLRYLVFETGWNLSGHQDSNSTVMKLGEPYRRLMVKMIHGLDIKQLLPVDSDKNAYKFYLVFPATAKHTSNFLAAWIKECNPQSRIHDSQKEGSWDHFRNTVDAGVVLVHETAAASLHCLPHLFDVILKKPFAFWCISEGDSMYSLFPSREYDPGVGMGHITATRLFPTGCAMLLTPSFIVAEPKRAYDLLKLFAHKQKNSVPGTWKLVCAHNIINYVLDLAISKALEKEAFEIENRDNPAKDSMLTDLGLSFDHCNFRNKVHTMFVHLDAQGLLDNPVDLDGSDSEYAFHEEREGPIVQAARFIDPDDEPALIEWFAGWSMRNLDVFRKFVVFGTGPSSARRAKRMKEYIVAPDANNSDSWTKIRGFAESPGTPNSNLRSFTLLKKENLALADSGNASTQHDQRQTALDVAARLSALSPKKSSLTTRTTYEISANLPSSPTHEKQPSEQTRHGIDQSLRPKQLQFCAATGGSVNEATTFLARANDDIALAISLYQQQEDNDAMDIGAQISQLITIEANKKLCPLRIATAEDDLARAKELSTSLHPNTSPFDGPESARSLPQYDGAGDAYHTNSPRYDGTDDRPSSSSSVNTTNSGIVTGANGQRVVPSSVRANNTIRKEIRVRPGWVPTEDIERYVSPGVASCGATRTPSLRGSPAPHINSTHATNSPAPIAEEPDLMVMDIDSGVEAGSTVVEVVGAGSGMDIDTGIDTDNGIDPKSAKKEEKKKAVVKKEIRQYTFQETSAWYENYKKTNGGGWEHIFVGNYDDVIKKTGLNSTK